MQYVKQVLSITLLIVSVVACCAQENIADENQEGNEPQTMDEKPTKVITNNVVEDLRAVITNRPEEDAKTALASGDRRLWGYHTRGQKHIPAVDGSSPEYDRYDIKVPPGMGDTVYRGAHMQLRKQFIEYAEKYNKIILGAQ